MTKPIENTDDGNEFVIDHNPHISEEQFLWLNVLNTFFHDMELYGHRDIVARILLNEAATEWAEFICEMAGIDYDYFTTKLFNLYRKRERWKHYPTRERWIRQNFL